MRFEDRFVNGHWWSAKEQQETLNEIKKRLPDSIYEEDGQKYILAKEIIKPLPEWHPIRLAIEMSLRGENGNVPYEVERNVCDKDRL